MGEPPLYPLLLKQLCSARCHDFLVTKGKKPVLVCVIEGSSPQTQKSTDQQGQAEEPQ